MGGGKEMPGNPYLMASTSAGRGRQQLLLGEVQEIHPRCQQVFEAVRG